MLGQSLLHSNALELSLSACFLAFNSFMMSKVLHVFGVIIGFIGLGLRCRMELFCHGKTEVRRIWEAVLGRSYLRDVKRILENKGGCLGFVKRWHSNAVHTTFNIVVVAFSA